MIHPQPEDIRRFLHEDLGSGDLTTAIIPDDRQAQAWVSSREPMVMCGQEWFAAVFAELNERVAIRWHVGEGEHLPAPVKICSIEGPARAILSGERTALNLLQTLCATATVAARYAEQVKGTRCRVLDTRKTLPGLRQAQKYAVRCGGCSNHRMGLFDGILIKENHIVAAGSIARAIEQCRAMYPGMSLEIEVENFDELEQALQAGADRILLDNFDLEPLREAVKLTGGRAELEASGNIDSDRLRQVAETGVDFVSIGALTKNIVAIDLSMRIMLINGQQ